MKISHIISSLVYGTNRLTPTTSERMDPNYIAIEFLCPVCNTLPINGAVLAEDGVSET